MSARQPDERAHGSGREDSVDDRFELGRVSSVETRGDLRDQPGTGEHLVAPHQLTARIEHLGGEGVDLRAGQAERELWRSGAGSLERISESLHAPADLGELLLPHGDELVGAGVALHGPGVTRCNAACPIAAVAGLGEVRVDLIGALRVQVTHGLGDAGDPPMPQVP
jgi:hypothetical protein